MTQDFNLDKMSGRINFARFFRGHIFDIREHILTCNPVPTPDNVLDYLLTELDAPEHVLLGVPEDQLELAKKEIRSLVKSEIADGCLYATKSSAVSSSRSRQGKV